MTETPSLDSVRSALRRATTRIAREGTDGAPPVEEIEAIREHGDLVIEGIDEALRTTRPERLAALVHLVRLLGLEEIAPAVAMETLETDAPLDAKVAAIDLLDQVGEPVPAEAEERIEWAQALVEGDERAWDEVAAWPEQWWRPAVLAWIAESGRANPEAVERFLGADAEIDVALLKWLGESGDAAALPILQRYVDADERTLAKAARRARHQLGNAGVAAPEPEEKPRFSMAIDPDVRRNARAFVTGLDGSGARIVWISVPSATGGQRLLEAVIDDARGVRRADVIAVTKKGFRRHVDRLRGNESILIAAPAVDRVIGMLRDAQALNDDSGEELPPAYAEWRAGPAADLFAGDGDSEAAVADATDAPAATAAGAAAAPEATADLVARSAELLERPYFSSWAYVDEAARTAAEAVRRAETSRVIVDDEQRKVQIDEAVAGAAQGFDLATRARYRRRLEDMAEVLAITGHDEESAIAAAAATGLEEVADVYASHPFVRAIVQRGVYVVYQDLRKHEEAHASESRIVTP